MSIPVFHDDQHGTAIISGAALLNALDLSARRSRTCGSSSPAPAPPPSPARSCTCGWASAARTSRSCDTQGVIYEGPHRGHGPVQGASSPADDRPRTLADALVGADVFVGLSVGGAVTRGHGRAAWRATRSSSRMANPDPEILRRGVRAGAAGRDHRHRPSATTRTRSTTSSGFPFIFRGALDVRASRINEEMKLAAVRALAEALARAGSVPAAVRQAYRRSTSTSGRTTSSRSRSTRACCCGWRRRWRRRRWTEAWRGGRSTLRRTRSTCRGRSGT